jgi:hypothetical protein
MNSKGKNKSSNIVLIIALVFIGITVLAGSGYGAYKFYFEDKLNSSASSTSIDEFEALGDDSNKLTEIEKSEEFISLITEAKLYVAHSIPLETEAIKAIKDDSSFYIYVKFTEPVQLELRSPKNIKVTELYIFGPNETGDSVLAKPEGESKWNSYALPMPVEEKIYELVFDKDYDELKSNLAFEFPELGVATTINTNLCTIGDHIGSEAKAVPEPSSSGDPLDPDVVIEEESTIGGDEDDEFNNSQSDTSQPHPETPVEINESYYRFNCIQKSIIANAKVLINPVITGGGFGFDATQRGMHSQEGLSNDDLTETSTELNILGETFTKTTREIKTSTQTYIEVYYSNKNGEHEFVSRINDTSVIFGYEIEYPNSDQETADEIQQALDKIFTSMSYIN